MISAMTRAAEPSPRLMQSLTLKWRVLVVYWLAHAVLAYAIMGAWWAMSGEVDGPSGEYFGFDGIGQTPEVWLDPGFALQMAAYVGVWVVLQLLLVLPYRAPSRSARGVPVWLSITAAALIFAGLVVGLIAAFVWMLGEYDLMDELPIDDWLGLGVVVALHWMLLTPVVAAFARKSRDRETMTRRLARAVFAGSVLDFALMIPLDVMIRRKTSCYCWSATQVTLPAAAALALLALGPMFWLPLAAKRRRRPLCRQCGYDLSSTPGDQCPECGANPARLEPPSNNAT